MGFNFSRAIGISLRASSARRTVALAPRAGTDDMANEFLSSKRSTTKWPLMLINMQLSASLARARLSLHLRRRPRENVEADQLTKEQFDDFSLACRVPIIFGDLDLSLVEALWKTKSQFDAARQDAKVLDKTLVPTKKRKHDKTPW